jgi:carbon-monoxide dehydrogenase iron sulfur subunit
VRSLGDLETYRLGSQPFEHLVQTNAAFSALLREAGRIRILRQSPVFRALSETDLKPIARLLEARTCDEGEVVFDEGDKPVAFYIIVSGSVDVAHTTKWGKRATVACLEAGDIFGELSLIEGGPRSASVTCAEPTRLLVLPFGPLRGLLRSNAIISFEMMKVIARRMREASREVSRVAGHSFFRGMTIVPRPDRCMKCRSCEIACAVAKSSSQSLLGAVYETPLPVKRIHVRRGSVGGGPVVRPEHCQQCDDAPCVIACRHHNAIRYDRATDTICVDEDRCVGCGHCARACPYKVITLVRREAGQKKRVALKCTQCAENRSGPACVRSCPTNALLIALAPASVSG